MKILIYTIFILFFIYLPSISQTYQNIPLTTNPYDQSETAIAINPLNNDILFSAWNDFQNNNIPNPGYAFSIDGGNTWDVSLIQFPYYQRGFTPSVSFDNFGNAFLCYIFKEDALPIVRISKTTNLGNSWDHFPVTYSKSDAPFLMVDNTNGQYNGRIYVSWTDFSEGNAQQIRFAYSTDHGNSWSNYQILMTTETIIYPQLESVIMEPGIEPKGIDSEGTKFVQNSTMAVGPNGELCVAWFFYDEGNGVIHLRKSIDGGQTFYPNLDDPPILIAYNFNPVWPAFGSYHGAADARTKPTIAVDPTNGFVYAAYIAWNNDLHNIYFSRSTDGGINWSIPRLVTDFTENYQFFPWLTVDQAGRISLSYYHCVYQGPMPYIDLYVAESFDHGKNFRIPNIKVTSESSSPYNATKTYHYTGMVSLANGDLYPLWTDHRNGNSDPYFAKVNPPPFAPQNLYVDFAVNNHPTVHWDANIETDVKGYHVYRMISPPYQQERLTSTPTTDTFYVDTEVIQGEQFQAHYWAKAVDTTDQLSEASNSDYVWGMYPKKGVVLSNVNIIPSNYHLEANYPNPFNPSTNITFGLPKDEFVEMNVFSLTGQKVKTLISGFLEKGYHTVTWNGVNENGSPVSAGIYIYELKTGDKRLVKKMFLMK